MAGVRNFGLGLRSIDCPRVLRLQCTAASVADFTTFAEVSGHFLRTGNCRCRHLHHSGWSCTTLQGPP